MLFELWAGMRAGWRHAVNHAFGSLATAGALGVGIGGILVVYAIAKPTLFRPFPYPDASAVALAWYDRGDGSRAGISLERIERWRLQHAGGAVDAAAYLPGEPAALAQSEVGRIQTAYVGNGLFRLLGVRPSAGRVFGLQDETPDAARVAVVSDRLARSRLSATPAPSVFVDGKAHAVIGVMPAGFFFPDTGVDIWLPFHRDDPLFQARDVPIAHAVLRLANGVTPAAAAVALNASYPRQPPANGTPRVRVTSIEELVIGRSRRAAVAVAACLVIIYLIACLNVGNAVLVRSLEQQRAMAVRVAVGARRRHLAARALGETLVPAGFGTVLGVCCAVGSLAVLRESWSVLFPRLPEGPLVDFQALAVVGLTALAAPWFMSSTAIVYLSAIVPRASRHEVGLLAGRRPIGMRLSAASVICQTGLATALLSSAVVLVGSFVALANVNWGFTPDRLTIARIGVPVLRRADPAYSEFVIGLRSHLLRMPGVVAAAVTPNVPIRWSAWRPINLRVGRESLAMRRASLWNVGPGHFKALGIPILAGREFDESDPLGRPVVIVARALADRLWPGKSPLGETLRPLDYRNDGHDLLPEIIARMNRRDTSLENDPAAFQDAEPLPREVIGVVENVRMFGLELQPDEAVYVSILQPVAPRGAPREELFTVVRSAVSAASYAVVRRVIGNFDRDVELHELTTGEDLIRDSIGGRTTTGVVAVIVGVLGGCALVLVIVGLHVATAYAVGRQARDLSIRFALGMAPALAACRIIWQSAVWSMCGSALGTALGFALNVGLQVFLFDVSPISVAAWIVGPLVSVGAVLASVPAAARASGIGPLLSTRQHSSLLG